MKDFTEIKLRGQVQNYRLFKKLTQKWISLSLEHTKLSLKPSK